MTASVEYSTGFESYEEMQYALLSDDGRQLHYESFAEAEALLGMARDGHDIRIPNLREDYNNLYMRFSETYNMEPGSYNAFHRDDQRFPTGGANRSGSRLIRMLSTELPDEQALALKEDELEDTVTTFFQDTGIFATRFQEMRSGSGGITSYTAERLAVEIALHKLLGIAVERFRALGATDDEIADLMK